MVENKKLEDGYKIMGSFALGILAGTALMFIMDPISGRRRRSLAIDKATGFKNKVVETGIKKAKHVRNRAQGAVAEVQKQLM